MYQDSDSGVWNTSAEEEKWIEERARELAAEAFNRADPTEFDTWIEYEYANLAKFVAAVVKLEYLCPPLRPLVEGLREAYIDDNAPYYEEDAFNEYLERQPKEPEDA